MMLAAGKGSSVTVEALGADAEAALAAILQLIGDKFGEGE
jgi:phosphocarrier protein